MATIVATRAPALPVPGPAARQLLRFRVVGALGTVLSALLYAAFRTWWAELPANVAAIVLSTVASTAANRRFTFGGARVDRGRELVQNAATVLFCLFSSSAALLVLDVLVDDPTVLQESLAVTGAAVLGGLARFVALRSWVFVTVCSDRTRRVVP